MYKAKIVNINKDFTYSIEIPSLGIISEPAHLIINKGQVSKLELGDLVIATETAQGDWIILGYIYGQKGTI